MSIEGDLTPAPQPESGQPLPPAAPAVAAEPQSWFLRHRRLLIPAGAVLALGAVSAAAVLILAKQTSTIEKMVPASADVIAVANLDPSVAQKVNLLRAVHSFPDYKTDKAITDKLDLAFKDSGFSFSTDVQPWLGPQVAVSAQLNLTSTKDSPAAVYIASRDDTKAKAMLAKLRASKYGTKFQWKDETYNGITISVGTPTDKSAQTAAYSLVDHVVVFATTSVQIHDIIDTDQGRAAKLIDSSDFKATPAVSLALKNLNDVDALQGIGATLSANGDGILADILVKVDQSKLSPATRDAFAHAGKADVVVKWIPQTSEGFLAITGLNRTIQAALDQSGNQASVKAATDSIGLTGTAGLLPHLTGDAGLEVEFSGTGLPAGLSQSDHRYPQEWSEHRLRRDLQVREQRVAGQPVGHRLPGHRQAGGCDPQIAIRIPGRTWLRHRAVGQRGPGQGRDPHRVEPGRPGDRTVLRGRPLAAVRIRCARWTACQSTW